MIDKLSVEVLVKDSQLELFPFVFTMDRYKLGVLGYNDLALNINYHVSVLESPIPFKFGINVKGNPDKLKVRLGRAKFKENMALISLQNMFYTYFESKTKKVRGCLMTQTQNNRLTF